MMHGMGRFYDTFGSYPMGWMYFSVIILVLLLAVLLCVLRRKDDGASGRSCDLSPMDIVKRRYAQGEITKEEFERFKKDLEE